MKDRSLVVNKDPHKAFRDASGATRGGDGYIDLARVGAAARRQSRLIVRCMLIGLALSIVYIIQAVPRYAAVETILFDEDRAEILDEVSLVPRAIVSDTAIQGEVEIIKSQALALRVVDELKLDQNDEFLNPPVSLFGGIKRAIRSLMRPVQNLFTSAPTPVPASGAESDNADDVRETPRTRAAQILRNHLEVERIRRSFVLDIRYLGYDPVRATRIARAFGDAYKKFQLQVNYEVASQAGDWLTQRLNELEKQSLDVAQDLEKFRLQHKLVSVKGALLSEQQLSETLTKLIEAEADAAQAQARLSQYEGLIERAAGEAIATATIATDTPSDEIIAKLRLDYFETTSRYRDVTGRWGSDHPEAVRVLGRLKEIELDLLGEMRHVTAALRAEHQISLSRVASLQLNLDAINAESSNATDLVGKLRQLEEEATIYREMYQEFLRRYEMTRQQQVFPVASVETISSATVPKGAAEPRVNASLVLGILLGGLVGAGIGVVREMREQPLRTRADLKETLGMRLIGSVSFGSTGDERYKADQLYVRALHALRSQFAPLSGTTGARSIGFSPVLSGKKSTLSRKFAEFLATNGARVLYIETIPGEPDVYEIEGPDSVGANLGTVSSAIYRREVEASGTSIDVLFLGVAQLMPDRPNAEALPEDLIEEVMDDVKQRYDFIVVNLPPLSVNMTANTFSRSVDSVVMTLVWGEIYPSVVRAALEENTGFEDNLAGALFVDTDLAELRHYVQPGTFEASSLEIH